MKDMRFGQDHMPRSKSLPLGSEGTMSHAEFSGMPGSDSATSFPKSFEWFDIENVVDDMDAAMDAKLNALYPADCQAKAKMCASLPMDSSPIPGSPMHTTSPSQAKYPGSPSSKRANQKKAPQRLNMAGKISNKFLNGYDALVEAFRNTKKGKEAGQKKQMKEVKPKSKKAPKDDQYVKSLRNTQFVHALKETFMQRIPDMNTYWTQLSRMESCGSRSGPSPKKSSGRKGGTTKGVTTPAKLKRQNSGKRSSLVRSLSDIPMGSSSNFDKQGGFTVEGAIQDLLAGPRRLRKEALPVDLQNEYAGLIEQREKLEMERLRQVQEHTMAYADAVEPMPSPSHVESSHNMGGMIYTYNPDMNMKYQNQVYSRPLEPHWTSHSDAEISYVMQDVTGGLVSPVGSPRMTGPMHHQVATLMPPVLSEHGGEWTNSPSPQSVFDALPSDKASNGCEVPIARCVSNKW